MTLQAPHGPKAITKNGQVVLPKEVLEIAGLEGGRDKVYLIPYDDPPGSILLVPMEQLVRWIERGRSEERQPDPQRPPE